ncbi:MAG: NTP transferase domain-containing protein [Roseibacillus sp.]|nr:NTP transferase domain-containing protein [Roseibacillus sp.]
MQEPTLLVLAAGMGSRYGGLKQMAPMGPHEETILDYSLYDAIFCGFRRVVFVIRDEFEEAFRTSIGERFSDRVEVAYAFQRLDDVPAGFETPDDRIKPWGTAHAVYAARHAVSGPFAVINADDFYGRDAYTQAATFLSHMRTDRPPSYCLVAYHLGATLSEHGGVNRGVTSHSEGLLQDVEEIGGIGRQEDGRVLGFTADGSERELTEDALVSMNFWGFTPNLFTQLEESLLSFLESCADPVTAEWHIPTAVDGLLKNGQASCRVLASRGDWFGVTHREDKAQAVETIGKLVSAGEYPSPLT